MLRNKENRKKKPVNTHTHTHTTTSGLKQSLPLILPGPFLVNEHPLAMSAAAAAAAAKSLQSCLTLCNP